MIIDTVITATNINPLYYDFIPMFIKAWNILFPEVNVKIILVHDNIPKNIQEYKDNIILFPPLPNINTGFISQIIRLFYPALINTQNGVIITDMDMIPMNRSYYIDHIKKYSNDKFISYRDVLLHLGEIPICYNVATPKLWGELFHIKDIDDIKNVIYGFYENIEYSGVHGGAGWTTDQKLLYNTVMRWNDKTGNLVLLNDNITKFLRMDRIYGVDIHYQSINDMRSGKYTDYHMLRPYSKYKNKNDKIIEILKEHYEACAPKLSNKISYITDIKNDRRLTDSAKGTFMACLITSVMNTTGPVLELGCNDYSTPLLHSICKRQNRYLLSTSSSENIIMDFLDMNTKNHDFEYVSSTNMWENVGIGKRWGVVLVNHDDSRKVKDVIRLKDSSDISVIYGKNSDAFNNFTYRYVYNRYNVNTVVLSDTIDVRGLFEINGVNTTLASNYQYIDLDSKNISEWQNIDNAGYVYPWYTKPFLEELSNWCIEDWDVFEYGCGYSSIWWAIYANTVTSVDNNYSWVSSVNNYYKKHNINNANVMYRIINEEYTIGEGGSFSPYVNSINENDKLYDCIIIDGECRNTCIYEALKHIKKGGVIILDNADQTSVGLNSKETFKVLSKYKKKSFKQHNHQDWRTDYWIITDNPPTRRSMYNRELSDPEYGTHMAPLITAVINTTGPVFELGCGDYSTPLLHSICTKQRRFLLSTDTSKEWIRLFIDMKNEKHHFVYVPVYKDDWALDPAPNMWDNIGNDKEWGVVFIDHRPGDRRKEDIVRLGDKAKIIVVHDTEQLAYGYEPILNRFKYRYDYKRYNVYTTLVSNSINVKNLFI